MDRKLNQRRRFRAVPLSRGMALVEALMSIVIVSVLMVAALSTVGSVAKDRSSRNERRQAIDLAQALLAEIMQSYYQDPGSAPVFGREAGELATDRSAWNDVDDYNGLSESPPKSKTASALTDWNGWTRSVNVVFASVANPASNSLTDLGLKRVAVTVTSPRGRSYTLTGVRSKYGIYEQSVCYSKQYVTWVRARLRATRATQLSQATAHPCNEAKSQP